VNSRLRPTVARLLDDARSASFATVPAAIVATGDRLTLTLRERDG
jgi:hypothetical protein